MQEREIEINFIPGFVQETFGSKNRVLFHTTGRVSKTPENDRSTQFPNIKGIAQPDELRTSNGENRESGDKQKMKGENRMEYPVGKGRVGIDVKSAKTV